MPVYTYRCRYCEHEFDERVAYDDRDRERSCPRCGQGSTVRLIPVPVFPLGARRGRDDRASASGCGCGGSCSCGGGRF